MKPHIYDEDVNYCIKCENPKTIIDSYGMAECNELAIQHYTIEELLDLLARSNTRVYSNFREEQIRYKLEHEKVY